MYGSRLNEHLINPFALFSAYCKMTQAYVTPQLDFRAGAALGVSPLLPNSCQGGVGGAPNPDGRCVPAKVYYIPMVPYSGGNVASTDYGALNTIYERGNSTRLASATTNRRS